MKISIVIPAYNAEQYLTECLESILSQGVQNTEIIIINDGSTDRTEEICQQYSKKYSYIKYESCENKGVSAARNRGIELATGEWLTFLDADDKLQKNSLVCFNEIKEKSDVILCDYSEKIIENKVDKNRFLVNIPKLIVSQAVLNLPNYIDEIRQTAYQIDGVNNWTCWGKFYNTKLIKDNKLKFVKGITHGEDLIFVYQVFQRAKKITYFPINLYYYRTNNESVSRTFNEKRIDNTLKLFDVLKQYDESLVKNIDYKHFIVDRILACCVLYYADRTNKMSDEDKKKGLKEICDIEFVHDAICTCPAKKLSIGKKMNVVYIVIFLLLKIECYGVAINVSRLLCR